MIDFCQLQQAAKSQRSPNAGHSEAVRLPSDLQEELQRDSLRLHCRIRESFHGLLAIDMVNDDVKNIVGVNLVDCLY